MRFRSAYGYDAKQASDEAADIGDYGPSMTVQSQAEDADINVMMKRMNITGQLPVNPRLPSYGDFSEITDYRSALHAVMDADEAFMELPADVRAKFDNDPQKLLMFTMDPANIKKLQDMGLGKAIPKEVIAKVEVVNGSVQASGGSAGASGAASGSGAGSGAGGAAGGASAGGGSGAGAVGAR